MSMPNWFDSTFNVEISLSKSGLQKDNVLSSA
jgi:hypothetical protein